MFEVKNFDNWIEDKVSGKFGSGASEKIWLINPETNEKGLFKFPKVKDKEKGIITGEYWAEKLATEIGKLIDVECATVDIGTYNDRLGSMSYNIVNHGYSGYTHNLIEGIAYIQNRYPYYDKDTLEDTYSKNKYSIQMIQNSLIGIEFSKFYKVIIFDILIGNSDRHHSNWATIVKETEVKKFNDMVIEASYEISPLYDNGSSLCAYVNESDVELILNDKMRFESLVNTKSKSAIGWNNIRPIRHFELLEKIKENDYELTLPYIENTKKNITENSIDKLLKEFDNEIINENMKKLLKMYLLERRKRMLEIYNLKDEV